ncbi:MAG: SgcJ/EcaC family oxidoreductase [Actinomycetes bacterium]
MRDTLKTTVATVHPSDAASADTDALIEGVSTLERCQRQEDVDGFLELFDESAVWVNGAGRRLIGLDEIAAFTRQVLPGAFATGSVNYEVQHILFIRSDVALTGVRQEYLDAEGQPLGEAAFGSPSYVWRRRGDTWKIIAGQNTAVIDPVTA